jgi:hypothetical protein
MTTTTNNNSNAGQALAALLGGLNISGGNGTIYNSSGNPQP